MDKQQELKKSYAILSSIKQNLPKNHFVEKKYLNMYHKEIERLNKFGFDLSEFKISEDEMERQFIGGNYVTKEYKYSDEKYSKRPFLMTKLDALLNYFELASSDSKIGFSLE